MISVVVFDKPRMHGSSPRRGSSQVSGVRSENSPRFCYRIEGATILFNTFLTVVV